MDNKTEDQLVTAQKEIVAKAQVLLLTELNKPAPDLKRSNEFSQILNNTCQSLQAISRKKESP